MTEKRKEFWAQPDADIHPGKKTKCDLCNGTGREPSVGRDAIARSERRVR